MSFLTTPHVVRRCQHCGASYKAVAWSEYVGDIGLGVLFALPVLLAFFHVISWVAGCFFAALVLVLSFVLWPYGTMFEAVPPVRDEPTTKKSV